MTQVTVGLYGLVDAVRGAARAEYDTDPQRWEPRNAWLFTAPVTERLIGAREELAAAIGPDRRDRAELSARNMSRPDRRTGEALAERVVQAEILAARHVAHAGAAGRIVEPGGLGACGCGKRGYCDVRSILRDSCRDVLQRGVIPGRTVARIVITRGWDWSASSAPVRGFFIDGCGGPCGCDYLAGGVDRVRRQLTTDEVAKYLRQRGAWRLLTRDEAAAAIVDAGYRLCGEPSHCHDFLPADAGPDVWRRSDAPAWHVDCGVWVAYVARNTTTN